MQDVKLIWLWEKWKQSIADELACDADAADEYMREPKQLNARSPRHERKGW